MNDDRCEEMKWLIQADVDQELDAAGAARVLTHLNGCDACSALHARLVQLSRQVKRDAGAFAVPAHLQQRLRAMTVTPPVPDDVDVRPPRVAPKAREPVGWLSPGRWGAFGMGAAAAALVALLTTFVFMPHASDGLPEAVVTAHVRGLQPGHLMDIASTDQHTVKPWFDGRIDYAPVVKDLAGDGFPLIGGRLDYLADRPVAALVYQRRGHLIDLYTWPERSGRDPRADAGVRNGYNFLRWQEGEMVYWAVSDVSTGELDTFASQWRSQ